tara:strand:- start:1610 stop:1864 length:255 start_codon:yes stop_codon:yes gene_type:complete
MISILVTVFKSIVTMLLKTAALKFLHPYLLKLDKWCEDTLGIDLIKQEKKFWEKYPGIYQRIEELEQENLNLAYQIEQIENKLK